MRVLNLVLAAALGLNIGLLPAQTQSEGSNWQHVQALSPGTRVHIKARNASASCSLKAVDTESLTCTGTKDITFQRPEIRSVKIPRRTRSTLIGGAIGAGAGLAIGVAISDNVPFAPGKPKSAGVGAAIFAPLGLIVGAATDFSRQTVYRAQ